MSLLSNEFTKINQKRFCLSMIPRDFSVLRYNNYVVRLNFNLVHDCSLVKLEYAFVLDLLSF